MTTTHTNKPKITQTDINNGYVTRYFVRNVSTKVVTEIDKKQYEAFKNNVLYERIEFPWVITGFANNQLSTDNKIIYGTKHKNTVTTQFYNKRLPGLDRVLRNPLEYFTGVDNTSELLVRLTPQTTIPTFQVSVPTSSVEPEPEIIPPLVTDGLILNLNAADPTSYAGSGTSWFDLSGNNYTATLVSSPTFDNSGFFTFDGSTDYATLGDIDNLDIGNGTARTICFWLKTPSNVSKAICTKTQTDTVESGWTINALNTGKINSILKNTGGTSVSLTSSGSINNNVWHEVSVIYRPSGVATSIYIDGIFDSNSTTLTGVLANNNRAVLIGGTHTPTNVIVPQYSGSISAFRIYNRELSASEILQNYDATKGEFGL